MTAWRWMVPAVVIVACAKVSTIGGDFDGGTGADPTVAEVSPQPGFVGGNAQFTVIFSAAMNEGQLLASSGRSETVVLATEAQVEQVAAAIAHDSLSALERALLLPASLQIAADRLSVTLVPDQPLDPGNYYLLVSPRLKNDAGQKLQGSGARFEFTVQAPPPHAQLVSPASGSEAPLNLPLVRATAPSGKLTLVAADGGVVASANAAGATVLTLAAPLAAGGQYTLALDGAVDATQAFTVGACARTSAPALQNGVAKVTARDTSVTAAVVLDWPAQVEVQAGLADAGEPCSQGSCLTASAAVSCAPPVCGPQSFSCAVSIDVQGLSPATDYALRVVANDDFGHSLHGPVQRFSTVAPLPRLLLSEVMATPSSPETNAEYVEIVNLGPGTAVLDGLGLMEPDGVVRPLSAAPPPTPVQLRPGDRALAAGAAFDATRYPSLPPLVPVMRASTQRLLSHGLADTATQAFQLVINGAVPVELSHFPVGTFHCTAGQSLQRDETLPGDEDGTWTCSPDGGTPGAPP
ncbi:MAG TPA: Ig-like domain-containing protein [Myxococcales bacterium]|nr:Ig-like domain-containing protein [Myxococcales bacterium]